MTQTPDTRQAFAYSSQMNALKVAMILCVVFIHENPTLEANGAAVMWWHSLMQGAVPVFFALSGYFYFRGAGQFSRAAYGRKLLRRCRTLLMPYLLWNLLPVLMVVGGNVFSIVVRGKSTDALMDFLGGLWRDGLWHIWWDKVGGTMPFDSPLWYVRDLMAVCLLSPLLYLGWRWLRWGLVVVLAAVFVSGVWSGFTGLSVSALLFFSFGASLALSGRWLTGLPVWAQRLLVVATIALFPLSNMAQVPWLGGLFTLLLCPFWLLVFSRISGGGKIAQLSDCVFFTLALHNTCVLALVGGLLGRLPLGGLSYWLAPPLTFAVCAILYHLLRRLFPRLMAVLCGGR